MTPSELVAIGKKLEELKRPEAIERQRQGGSIGGGSFRSTGQKLAGEPINTRSEVADAIGMSEATYKRAKRVVEVAEDETLQPAVYEAAQAARAKMDSGVQIATPAQRLRGSSFVLSDETHQSAQCLSCIAARAS